MDPNHWMLILHVPGSDVLDVTPPPEELTECPQQCRDICANAADAESAKKPADDQAAER